MRSGYTTHPATRGADPVAHFGHAHFLQRAGLLVEAVETYRSGLARWPGRVEAWSNLGTLLSRLGRHEEAEAAHLRALALAPKMAELHNNLGLTVQAAGRLPEAEALFRESLALSADGIFARVNLGRLLQVQGRHRESIEHYERVLLLQPANAQVHNNLGIALEQTGDLAGAAAAFQRAISIDSGLVAAHRGLADVLQRLVPQWHVPMLNDATRNEAYRAALSATIGPDSNVLEIGTGAGLITMLAASMNPRSVTTCEAEPLIAAAAREVIRVNRLDSRIKLIPKRSTELEPETDLPAPADILVSELFSSELLGERVLPTLEDAKRRLVRRDCRIIPATASVMIALCGGEAVASHSRVRQILGFDVQPFNQVVAGKQTLARDDLDIELLSDDVEAFFFDFERDSQWPPESKLLRIPVVAGGRCHGIVQWIRLGLDRSTRFENHPRGRLLSTSWTRLVYPLAAPVDVRPGQQALVRAIHDRVCPWFRVETFL